MNAFFWSFYGLHTILHTLNLGCSFRTHRDPCNNQRSRCDIAWLASCYKPFIPRLNGKTTEPDAAFDCLTV